MIQGSTYPHLQLFAKDREDFAVEIRNGTATGVDEAKRLPFLQLGKECCLECFDGCHGVVYVYFFARCWGA